MAYDFVRLADVEALSEVPENATVLAEVNGAIKRVPGSGLGGSGNTIVIVKNPNYSSASPMPIGTTSPDEFWTNMSLAEALTALRAYEITGAVYYYTSASGSEKSASSANGITMELACVQDVSSNYDTDCLRIRTWDSGVYYWTTNGISEFSPGGGGGGE